MTMRPRPVRRVRIPAYPTRLQVLAEPDILRRHQPPAWLRNAELTGAVAVFLAANGVVLAADRPAPLGPQGAAVVAPIFAHGEGRGVTGCVVVSPPVFLSEEEALQVIGEELGRAGVKLSQREVVLEGVKVPPRNYDYTQKGNSREEKLIEDPGNAAPLKVDGRDPEKRVAVEFVSYEDYGELGGPRSMSSVQRYEFKEVAGYVASQVRTQGKGVYFGAFYDPSGSLKRERTGASKTTAGTVEERRQRWQEELAAARRESQETLRAQVKDFVDWLKGQGAI